MIELIRKDDPRVQAEIRRAQKIMGDPRDTFAMCTMCGGCNPPHGEIVHAEWCPHD
jgi:hypothetical protein